MNIQVFDFKGQGVRSIVEDGEVFFVAKDIAEILEYSDSEIMTRKLDEDEKLNRKIDGSGQSRDMICLTESGLYSCILSSQKPEAKNFKRWITHEVLPTIRKTGSYTLPLRIPPVSLIKEFKELYGRNAAARYFAPHFGIDIDDPEVCLAPEPKKRICVFETIKPFVEIGEGKSAVLDDLYELYLHNTVETLVTKASFSKALSREVPVYRRRVKDEFGVFSTLCIGIGIKQ